MSTDTNDTGPSLFEDLVAGLAALDDRATLRVTVDVAGEHRQLVLPAARGPLVVGRSDDVDVVVAVAQASRRHAELRSEAGSVFCHDAGSSYGTWVDRDGQCLDVPVELTAGDRIVTFGDVVLLTVVEVHQ